jgi:beta-lactamase class A
LLLEKIYRRELVSPEASDEMLLILKHQKLRDRLPRYLPTGWLIAHKTGLLRKACHDVGIVFSPKGNYMICVMTGQDTNYRAAKQFIASVGRITFDYYQGGFHRPIYQSRRHEKMAATEIVAS